MDKTLGQLGFKEAIKVCKLRISKACLSEFQVLFKDSMIALYTFWFQINVKSSYIPCLKMILWAVQEVFLVKTMQKNIKRICRDKFKYIMCFISFCFRFTSSWGLITCQYIHKKRQPLFRRELPMRRRQSFEWVERDNKIK